MSYLPTIAQFLAKSGLRKPALAVYFWTSLLFYQWKAPRPLGDDFFSQLLMLILVAVFAGNVLEHYIRSRYPVKEAPSAQPQNPVV